MRGIFANFPVLMTTLIGLTPTVLLAQVTPVEYPLTQSAMIGTNQTSMLEAVAPLSLADAIQQAQRYSPIQNILATRQQVREAERLQSGLRLNPELSLSSVGLRSKQQEQSFAISQPLDLFGVRSAKQQLAQARVAGELTQQAVVQSKLSVLVMASFRQVVLAEQQLELARLQQQLSQQSVLATKHRFEAGRIAEVELARMNISQLQADNDLQSAQNQLTVARQNLSRYWGNSNPQFTKTTADSAWPKFSRTELMQRLANNPNQQLAKHAIVESNAQIKLAQSQAYSMPTVSVGMNRISDPNQQTYTQATLGLSVPLPIFSRHQGAILAAQSGQRLAELQQAMGQKQREQNLNRLLSQAENQEQRYQSIVNQQLPQIRIVQQKMLLGFKEGKFSVFEVQQAQRDRLQLEQAVLAIRAEGWNTALHIEALLSGFALDSDPNSTTLLDTLSTSLLTESMTDAASLAGATQ